MVYDDDDDDSINRLLPLDIYRLRHGLHELELSGKFVDCCYHEFEHPVVHTKIPARAHKQALDILVGLAPCTPVAMIPPCIKSGSPS